MKLVLLIEDKRLKDVTPAFRSPVPDDFEDATIVKVEAQGDVLQIMRQLRAVADSLMPPQRWVTGADGKGWSGDEEELTLKPGDLRIENA